MAERGKNRRPDSRIYPEPGAHRSHRGSARLSGKLWEGGVSAVFSEGGEETGLFRYRLDRHVQDDGIVAALCGVNPSTAGAEANDQTIRKDLGFARIHGWRQIIKVNKFAFRATD